MAIAFAKLVPGRKLFLSQRNVYQMRYFSGNSLESLGAIAQIASPCGAHVGSTWAGPWSPLQSHRGTYVGFAWGCTRDLRGAHVG